MPALNDIKLTIGGAETTAGSAANREYVLPVRALPGLRKTVERDIDPAIIGLGMDAGEYAVADDVAGPIPLTLRACGAVGQILNSLLGTEAIPTTSAAMMRVRYTGASDSCHLKLVGTVMTSSVGNLAAEAADTEFDSDGELDTTAYGTITSLIAAIDGFTGYDAERVYGATTALVSNLVAINRQAGNVWAYMSMTGSSTAHIHQFTANFATTQRPTYTIQSDGFQNRYLHDGCVVEQLTMSAALKGMVEGDVDILGFAETADPTASSLVLEDIGPMIFNDGSITIDNYEFIYARNMNLTIKNNHNPEGYGLGSISRQYHQKGKLEITGQIQVRLDAISILEKAKIATGALAGISFYFQSPDDIETSIPYQMLVELPYCTITDFDFPENAGQIDALVSFKALRPKATRYNDPITVHLITDDSAAY